MYFFKKKAKNQPDEENIKEESEIEKVMVNKVKVMSKMRMKKNKNIEHNHFFKTTFKR